jgi:hypothetical protein
LGRVTDVILPTGEKVKLTSDLSTDEGLSVKVAAPLQALKRGDKQRFMEFKMRNERSKMLTITDGKLPLFPRRISKRERSSGLLPFFYPERYYTIVASLLVHSTYGWSIVKIVLNILLKCCVARLPFLPLSI